MDVTLFAILKKYVNESIENIEGFEKGKSAYEVAIENGFIGSEEDWLKSLKGPAPYIGENGNWFVDKVDTGISATFSGTLDGYYSEENLTPLSTEEILKICQKGDNK